MLTLRNRTTKPLGVVSNNWLGGSLMPEVRDADGWLVDVHKLEPHAFVLTQFQTLGPGESVRRAFAWSERFREPPPGLLRVRFRYDPEPVADAAREAGTALW